MEVIGNQKFSGIELKSLMVNGKLPEEYITEENVLALLDYETKQLRFVMLEYGTEQIQNNEFYDLSAIIYCTDTLVRRYRNDDNNMVNKWDSVLMKARESLSDISRNSEAAASEFIIKMFETLGTKVEDKERLHSSVEKFVDILGQAENMKELPLFLQKEIKRRKIRFALKRHLTALLIAAVIVLPITIITFITFT